jgi:hypothetical protein
LSTGTLYTPILSQQYKINAENGLGFAACSLDDAQGNHADTYVNVTNGVVTTEQEVGFVDGKCSSGVYSSQELDESCAELVQAEAASEGANGDWAEVEAYASGFVKCVEQYAQTTTNNPVLLTSIPEPVSETKTFAEQKGSIGTFGGRHEEKHLADWASLEATALDHDGNLAVAFTEVYNGSVEFSQCANVETSTPTEFTGLALFPVSENKASTDQWVELKGTSATVADYAGSASGEIYSQVLTNFTNPCTKYGSLGITSWSEAEINGDTDTEAGLIGITGKPKDLKNFGLFAETDSDSDSSNKAFYIFYANAESDEHHSHAWVIP